MATGSDQRKARLTIDIDLELRHRIESAAAERDQTVRDFVVAALQTAMAAGEREKNPAEGMTWSQLSARSFARDWESEEDQAYDPLP